MASVGWTSTPNQRGTFDIIWICAETIFLCAWTSVCVNVPAPGRSPWRLLRDKAHFVFLAFLGPELVFLLSYVQLQSAKASVEEFRAAGFTDWTLVHAFYADMGGITVCSPSWPPFPVNTSQLFYLVRHGYMDYPKIPLEDIAARGQADGLSRLITICQVVYFAVTSIARVAQGLAFTTLELTVLGFILCTLATSICWWHKPNNVEVGHKFVLRKSIEDIVREAGQAANESYRETPLDFVTPERWSGNVLWPYYTNILRKIGLFRDRHRARPARRISSFAFLKPSTRRSEHLIFSLGIAYAATFLAAWNFYFPTETERLLWRVCSAAQLGLSASIGVLELTQLTWPAQEPVPAGGPCQERSRKPPQSHQ